MSSRNPRSAAGSGAAPLGYAEWLPPVGLAWAIECVWTRRSGDEAPGRNKILPDGCADLLFDLSPEGGLVGGGVSGRRAIAVGTMTEPLVAGVAPGTTLVGVRFRPGRALPFFGAPLEELVDRRVDLELLWPSASVRRMVERLAASDRPADWVDVVAAELSPCGACVPDRAVGEAVRAIVESEGRVRTGELAERLGVARQTLARRFRRQVGVGPKMLARVVRLRSTIERLDAVERVDWAQVALDQGFSDQAHLCAEFRELARDRPARLHAARRAS